jgi:two-component system chemotaxis response regulator CheY
MAKKILVVDDSLTIRQQVGHTLASAGYQIVEAVDGRDGLEKLGATPDVSVVISDINMPSMTGLEMLREIKTNVRSPVPVLMMTTEGSTKLIQEAKSLGAMGWIVKPFKPELLLAAVGKLAK